MPQDESLQSAVLRYESASSAGQSNITKQHIKWQTAGIITTMY